MSKKLLIPQICEAKKIQKNQYVAGVILQGLSPSTATNLWNIWTGVGSANVEIDTLRAVATVLNVDLIDLL